jgi:hypothetical protein
VKVLLNGAEVKPGHQALPADKPGVPFQASDDWFHNLTVVLKDLAEKKLVYADIRVWFLDTEDKTPQHSMIVDGNQIGERPKHARYSTIRGAWQNDPAREPILIEAGQEFGLSLSTQSDFDEVKQAIENKHSRSSITAVRLDGLDVATVYFEDGTKWAVGYFRHRHPRSVQCAAHRCSSR